MNLKESIRKVLREVTEQDDWYKDLLKKVKLIDTIIKSFYPNFNKDNASVKKSSSQMGNDVILYDDSETGITFATYWVDDRELVLTRELFETLENYLGDEEMTYVVEWFNNEFNQQAEYVTF
jgi:hypothetical protein